MNPKAILTAKSVEQQPDLSWDIIGAHSRVEVESVPVTLRVAIYLDLNITATDHAGENLLEIIVVDPDGRPYSRVHSDPPFSFDTPHFPFRSTKAATLQTGLGLEVEFTRPGEWRFEFRHNKVTWARLPYYVALADPSSPASTPPPAQPA